MRLITVPANSYAAFEAALSGLEAPAALEKVSADRTTVYALAVLLAEDRKPFEDALRQARGRRRSWRTPAAPRRWLIDRHRSSLTRLDEVQGQLQDERQQLAEHIDRDTPAAGHAVSGTEAAGGRAETRPDRERRFC